MLVLQVGNSSNWDLAWSNTFTAARISGKSYYPIPDVNVPILFEHNVIAVLATSNSAKANWRFAGFLNQKVTTGIIVGGQPDAELVQSRRLFVNRISLLILPKLSNTFSVVLHVPYWFEDISYNIWRYIGSQADSTEDLINQLQATTSRIEDRLNQR